MQDEPTRARIPPADLVEWQRVRHEEQMYFMLHAKAREIRQLRDDLMAQRYGIAKEDTVDANGIISRPPAPVPARADELAGVR